MPDTQWKVKSGILDQERHRVCGGESQDSRGHPSMALGSDSRNRLPYFIGSACSPVTATVFKTVGRRFTPPPVGSTPTRFRHFYVDLTPLRSLPETEHTGLAPANRHVFVARPRLRALALLRR